MFRWLSPIAGVALIVLALADIFLTVLYARIGTAFFTEALGAGLWKAFKRVAPRFPRHRDKILSFCGPVLLLVAVVAWIAALICGFALVLAQTREVDRLQRPEHAHPHRLRQRDVLQRLVPDDGVRR